IGRYRSSTPWCIKTSWRRIRWRISASGRMQKRKSASAGSRRKSQKFSRNAAWMPKSRMTSQTNQTDQADTNLPNEFFRYRRQSTVQAIMAADCVDWQKTQKHSHSHRGFGGGLFRGFQFHSAADRKSVVYG